MKINYGKIALWAELFTPLIGIVIGCAIVFGFATFLFWFFRYIKWLVEIF